MSMLAEIMVRFSADTLGFTTGSGAVVAGLVAVGAAIGESVKMAGDFQAGITNLSTAAGESGKNLGMVGDGIKNVAVETGTSTKDLIAAMFMIESSGQRGAAGLRTLQIAAQGAKTDNADLMTVSKALTGVMTGWPQTMNGAAGGMNELIVAASEGKMHLQDLSKAMGNVIPIASNAGVSFADIGAAVAMMTNRNMTAQRASQAVAFALRDLSAPSKVAQTAMASVGLTAQDLSDSLRTRGLGPTLKLITDAVGKTFPAGSIQATTALKNIMGGATGLNVALALGGKHLSEYEAGVAKVAAAARNGGQAVEGWSTVQGNFNTKVAQARASLEVLMITLGTELLPVLGRLVAQVAPLVMSFIAWEQHTHTVQNALASLVTAMTTIITAGAGLVSFFMHNQVALSLLEAALVIVAGVGIMLLIQALVGLAVAFGVATIAMLPEIATIAVLVAAIAGVILIIKNWGAICAWIGGVFSDMGSQMRASATQVKNDVGGAFSALGSFLTSTVAQFIGQVVAFFAALPGRAAGAISPILGTIGSILGSLVSQGIARAQQFIAGLIAQIATAPGRAASALSPMMGTVLGELASIAGAALQAGANIVQQIASGIMGAIGGAIGGAMNAVGSFIAAHLPASPAKMGPLRNLQRQGGEIANQLNIGLRANMPDVESSFAHLIAPTPGVHSGSSGQGTTQTIILQIDGRDLARALGPQLTKEVRLVTAVAR